MFVGVGPARHRDRHHAFINGRAAVGGIGAEGGERVHGEPPDAAVCIHAEPRLHPLVAGLDVADEGFQPVGGIFDRPAEDPADGRDRDLLAIDVQLDAEPAADIGRHHADEVLGDAEMARQRVLLVPGRLVAAMDGEPAFARVVVGDHGPRFERHAGMAREGEAALRDMRRPGKRGLRVAGPDRGGIGEIAAEFRMGRRGVLVQGAVADCGRRQRLPLDGNCGRGVFGERAAGGDHRGDGVALPDRAVHRDGMLRRRDQRWQMIHFPLPGGADRRNVGPGEHSCTRHGGERRRGIDLHDPGMRVRAPDEGEVEQAGKPEVVGIPAAAGGKPPCAAARQGPPDGFRPVSHGSAPA